MTNGTSVARCDLFLRNTTARYCGAHGNCLHIATNYHAGGRNKKQFIIIVLKLLRTFTGFLEIAKRT